MNFVLIYKHNSKYNYLRKIKLYWKAYSIKDANYAFNKLKYFFHFFIFVNKVVNSSLFKN